MKFWQIRNDTNHRARKLLQNKILLLNEIIYPGFKHDVLTKEKNPKEFFAVYVLHKIYSLNISLGNVVLANDVFLSVYLYRYVYELYIKVFYIFSGSSEEEILLRLNNFFENKDLKFSEYLDGINNYYVPAQIRDSHYEKYKTMSRMVHPNIESMKLHINRADEKQFEFLVPNVNLTLWHTIEVIRRLSGAISLDWGTKIDQKTLASFWSDKG